LTTVSSERRLRILVAHSFYRIPGGEDRYVQQQVKLLSGAHTVDLLAGTNESLRSGIPTAARMIFSFAKKREVTEAIRRFRPDIIHLHNAYPVLGPAVHLAASERGVPVILTVHNFRLRCPNGLMFTEGQPCRRCEGGAYFNAALHRCFPTRSQGTAYATALWAHRFIQRLERKIRLFIAPSGFMRERLMEWGIPGDLTEVVPHFVETRPDASPRVGSFGAYVGRLSTEKGLDVLLRALRTAGDPHFEIIGDGPAYDKLRAGAAQLELRNAQFLGRLGQDAVRKRLAQARFCVMPSVTEENLPMAVLEAMAVGRPVIVSAVGGLPELVADGSGLLCRPGDSVDLAKKMETLMKDDDQCYRAGSRALSAARNRFGPVAHLTHLERVYAKVRETVEGSVNGV
jgi:glycosyltransferase involved in cell wall biosynthesis